MSSHHIERVCDKCGTIFCVTPSELARKAARFCSRECAGLAKQRIELVCEHCGRTYEARPCESIRHFCSKECHNKSMESRVMVICVQCGKEVEKLPSQIHGQENFFCSHDCQGAWSMEHCRVTVPCDWCGKSIERTESKLDGAEYHFCDTDCQLAWLRRNRVDCVCEQCGQPFSVQPALADKRFCSAECWWAWSSEHFTGQNNPNWRGGPVGYYGSNWSRQTRRARKRDVTCQICGTPENVNGIALDVHHIGPFREFDGDWKKANRLSNLICLCRSCHASVDNGSIPCPMPLPAVAA